MKRVHTKRTTLHFFSRNGERFPVITPAPGGPIFSSSIYGSGFPGHLKKLEEFVTGFKISFPWLIFSLSFFNERRLFVVWAGRNFMLFSRRGESVRKRSVITWRGQIDSKLARIEIGVQSGSTHSRFWAERNFTDEKWEGCFAVTMSISRCRQQLTNPKSWARKLNNRLWCKDWAIFRSCFIAVRSRMFVCLLIAPTKVRQPAQKSLLTIKFQGTKKHQKLMSELYYWLFCYSLERWICVTVYNHFRLRTSLFMDSLRNTSLLFEGGLQRDMCSPKRLNTAGMAPTCDWMINL